MDVKAAHSSHPEIGTMATGLSTLALQYFRSMSIFTQPRALQCPLESLLDARTRVGCLSLLAKSSGLGA